MLIMSGFILEVLLPKVFILLTKAIISRIIAISYMTIVRLEKII